MIKNSNRLARLKTHRKLWLKVHLYLGLFTGAILLVIALTGSILSFWIEIDRWLNPELMIVDVPKQVITQPLNKIVSSANAAMPANAVFTYAYQPQKPDHASYFFYEVPVDESGNVHSMNVFVNPYTAEVIGTRMFYHATDLMHYCFMGIVFKLHYSLLAGDNGMIIVGILGVIFTVSTLSGLILWWPLTGKWSKALTIKAKASTVRFNYDLHKTLGFYFSVILLAVFISGISMNLPDQFTWLVERFSPVTIDDEYKTELKDNKAVITVEQAWKITKKRYPESLLYWFSVPNSTTGVFVFTLSSSLGSGFYGNHKIIVDRYGTVLHEFSPVSGSGGNVFMQWMWALHSGTALGMIGRVLVLISGIVSVVMFVTGFIRWLQKRKAAKLRLIRKIASTY